MKVLLIIAALCIAGIESLTKKDVQKLVDKAYFQCPVENNSCRFTCLLKKLNIYDDAGQFQRTGAKKLTPDGVNQNAVYNCAAKTKTTDCEADKTVFKCLINLIL